MALEEDRANSICSKVPVKSRLQYAKRVDTHSNEGKFLQYKASQMQSSPVQLFTAQLWLSIRLRARLVGRSVILRRKQDG